MEFGSTEVKMPQKAVNWVGTSGILFWTQIETLFGHELILVSEVQAGLASPHRLLTH